MRGWMLLAAAALSCACSSKALPIRPMGPDGAREDAVAACRCASDPETSTCPTVVELCALIGMRSCPASIDDLMATGMVDWIQVACGKRMLGQKGGLSGGFTYVFDETTGVLLGGTRYADTAWGACATIDYAFGDVSSLSSDDLWRGLVCTAARECRRAAAGSDAGVVDLATCLPGDNLDDG